MNAWKAKNTPDDTNTPSATGISDEMNTAETTSVLDEARTANRDKISRKSNAGKLVLCPTPLGNLGDITQRTLDMLRRADVVCAEDTRVTGKLLAAFGIKKRLERLDEAYIKNHTESIIGRVAAGEVVAYCSDAGMPGVSDPGARLVRAARIAGVSVEVLPGPSAAITAYVASGCTSSNFYFGGFFPRKDAERIALLEQLRNLDAALVFYESPKRLVGALKVCARIFPQRVGTVCREMTKLHEEVVQLPLRELCACFAQREEKTPIKGEIVLVIDGINDEEVKEYNRQAQSLAHDCAEQLKKQGKSNKEIVHALVEEFGISRNNAYNIALNRKQESNRKQERQEN